MMSLEQAIAQYEQFANVCEHHGLTASQEEFEQLAAWLRELQECRKEQYLTIEQIAVEVGTQTIHSAFLWIDFARTLDRLGYAVVKRRTDENNNLYV